MDDHGHVRSSLGEVRLDQVRLGTINEFMVPLEQVLKVSGQYLYFGRVIAVSKVK